MSAEHADEAEVSAAPHWSYGGGFGVLIFPAGSGVPDVPLRLALRSAAQSSVMGLAFGASALAALAWIDWNDYAFAAALAAVGVPTVKAGHRLVVAVTGLVAAVPCVLFVDTVVDGWFSHPWNEFVVLGASFAVTSQIATAAAYLPRRGHAQAPTAGP